MAPVSHSRGRRSGRTAAFAAASAVVVLGLAGCSIDLSDLAPGGTEEDDPSPEAAEPVEAAPLVEDALADLAQYQGLTATGQVAETVGADVQDASLTVADSGAASGTIRANDVEAELISADTNLYIRAAEGFWLDQGVFGPDFDDFDDNWVRSSAEQAGINPVTTLAPPELAEILGEIELESDEAEEENLDGTLTHRIDLAGEANQMWINEETGQVQRIEIEQLEPEGADEGPQVRLDLAEAEETEVEELYDGLLNTAEDELTSSRDARIEVSWEGQPDMSCEDGPNCTWSGTVNDASGAEAGTVHVHMDVTFTNDDIGDEECSDNGSLEAGGTLDLSCNADYNIVSETQQTYEIEAEAEISTRGLTGGQQEDMLEALEEQREATLAGETVEDEDEEEAEEEADD